MGRGYVALDRHGAVRIHPPARHAHVAGSADWSQGILLLALPQIALSLGNSVLATRQIVTDLFPERTPPSVTRIGLTYAFMNLTAPVLGGIPGVSRIGGHGGALHVRRHGRAAR